MTAFSSLKEAQILIEAWRHHYNAVRPHAALGWKPPAPEVRITPAALWPHPGPSIAMASNATVHEHSTRIRDRGLASTGSVYLEASMGGYHVFAARDERWIHEPCVFWAAEGEVELGIRREPLLTSFWAGDGLLEYQTTVQCDGNEVINGPGAVGEIELYDSEIIVRGLLVLGRTDALRYTVRRVTGFFR